MHYAGGQLMLLLELEADQFEIMDLGTSTSHAPIREALSSKLHAILDPEAINALAFSDQARVLHGHRGPPRIMAMPVSTHTPLDN
jgi:choline-sulfatase